MVPVVTGLLSLSTQNIPTLGAVAITMALHNCDEVAVAGFGYDMLTPHAPLHYYETVKMSAIKEVSSLPRQDTFMPLTVTTESRKRKASVILMINNGFEPGENNGYILYTFHI